MVELTKKLMLTLKVEYRFLYYNRRGGKIAGDLIRAINPFVPT